MRMVFPGRARQLSQPALAIYTLFLISILSRPLCLDKEFDAKFNLPVSGFPLPVTAVYIRSGQSGHGILSTLRLLTTPKLPAERRMLTITPTAMS